jgi:hypothetical protein
MNYGYGFNKEDFFVEVGSRDETIAEARACYGEDAEFYIAKMVRPVLNFDAEHILESAMDSCEDQFPECSEGWLNSIPIKKLGELSELVTATINTWLVAEGFNPKWFLADEIEKIEAVSK